MANYSELSTLIDAYINRNGVQAITGQVLNGVLRAMVSQLGRGYTVMGVAFPDDNPGQPDGPSTWFAGDEGVYTNFGGVEVNPGEVALISYDNGWSKVSLYDGIQGTSATIDDTQGDPAVAVSYTDGVLTFNFSGLVGPDGPIGPAGVTSAVVTVDNTSGTPSCAVSLVGSVLHLDFTGLKGAQGNTGSSVDYPFTIVNNLTTDDATQALSAAQGYQIGQDLGQIEKKVDLMYPEVIESTSVDPNTQTLYNYQINSSNEYTTNTNYKHIRVPVVPGQKVWIVASSHSAQMAWLRNDNAPVSGGTPAFVPGTSRFDLAAGGQDVYTVPDGAVLMYIYAGQSPYAFLPASISITTSKVHDVVDALDSDSSTDALSALQGHNLDRGFSLVSLPITTTTKLMISDNAPHYFQTNSSSTYVVYSVPVVKGDRIRLTASDTSAHTIRYGFSNGITTSYIVFNYKGGSFDSVDDTMDAPLDGFFVVYHISTYFADMAFRKLIPTTEGATVNANASVLELLAKVAGTGDFEKVIPSWKDGFFQYYNQSTDASSSSFNRTGRIYTNGRKWLYFTQNVSTGTGTAGIRFFDEDNNGIFGYRQIIEADAAGLKPVLVEIPDGTSYFQASCLASKIDSWFAYLFDDDKLANLIREAEDTKHIKVCLLGNSYTADAWRYVPKMLLEYGITIESFFYYRGQGSLYDLDTQWTDTSPTGTSDYDGLQHSRITFYVNSANDPVWREWGTILSAADIVGRRKWDIISLQQGGNRCKDIDSYAPSLQNIIDKIQNICTYPYTLCWYEAYNGATQNITEGMNQQSLDTQKTIVKTYPFKMVIPAAAAVFSAQDDGTLSQLGASTYKRMYANDNVHMQEGLPCYVAACTVCQSILDVFKPGKSVMGDPFRATAANIANLGMSQTANGSSTGVTEDNCKKAQQFAVFASKNPFEML